MITRILYFILTLVLANNVFGQDHSAHFRSITVPVDYEGGVKGTTTVSYELGAKFSQSKPTVFIVADAQQFYVRRGTIASLQASLFDNTFNVVGIIGRNNNDDLKQLVTGEVGTIDWIKAYEVFSWYQYVNDINQVRKKLLGENGHIYLYGQSGGGFLVHQFLSKYGQFVDKAFTGAALNYQLDAETGINHDQFWQEMVSSDSSVVAGVKRLLGKNTVDRAIIAMLFQRQHFFTKPDSLLFERKKLLNVFLTDDTVTINQYRRRYQVDAILNFYSTSEGIPIKVRLFEFIFPLLNNFNIKPDILQPDLENLYFSSLALVNLYKAHKIHPKMLDFKKQHTLPGDIFILAGRWDHTADYRSQIALAFGYPNHILFIANDNHTFEKLKEDGTYKNMILQFLKGETNAANKVDVISKYSTHLWKE